MIKKTKKPVMFGAVGVLTAGMLLLATPGAASAHGHVDSAYGDVISRSAATQNVNRGAVAYEPQSLEAPKGYPTAGPADGKLASAGGLFGGTLDEQSANRWWKNDISTGDVEIGWRYTAPHKTSQWRYYITKEGWDPNDKLERSDFVLLKTINHDGSAANSNPGPHVITIPDSYQGYHVIYAVWDVADTVNAFYNVIDVNITGTGHTNPHPTPTPTPTPNPGTPTDVSHIHSMGTTHEKVALMWSPSTYPDPSYRVERTNTANGQKALFNVGNVTEYDDTTVAPSTTYTYRVYTVSGSTTTPGSNFTVTTKAAPTVPTPAPTPNGTWDSKAFYAKGATVTYNGSTYVAVQSHQGVGDPNWITALSLWKKTDAAVNPAPTAPPTTAPTPTNPAPAAGTWDSKGLYKKGDTVTYNGSTYVAVQSHQGVGDPNWITALSLWKKL